MILFILIIKRGIPLIGVTTPLLCGCTKLRTGFPTSYIVFFIMFNDLNHIGGVVVSMLASIAVDRWFESRSCQTKDYKIGICCFSAKHAALRRRRNNNGWLAWNHDNVSELGNMSIRRLLFQWACTIQMQLSLLVKYKVDLIIISLKLILFSLKNCWVGVKQQSTIILSLTQWFEVTVRCVNIGEIVDLHLLFVPYYVLFHIKCRTMIMVSPSSGV